MNEINAVKINNFLDEAQINQLIADFELYVTSSRSKFHGGRTYLPNTDDEFNDLVEKSAAWDDLYKKINSEDFMLFCLSELGVRNVNKFKFFKFFTRRIPSVFQKVHQLRAKRVREISFLGLSAYYLYLIYRWSSFMLLKFRHFFTNTRTVELLFDISTAENGYSREIHRDSDSRMVVFLLYFNSLEGNGSGGTLDLHKYIGMHPEDPPCRPVDNDCITINSIKAEAGNLIIFKNDNHAFHSVPLMTGYNNQRLFCYGSFTITAGSNPFLKKHSKYKMTTQWRMWL